MEISQAISDVKTAKATALFWADVKTYGSQQRALRALDCQTREEAVKMLSVVQTVHVLKCMGQVIVN